MLAQLAYKSIIIYAKAANGWSPRSADLLSIVAVNWTTRSSILKLLPPHWATVLAMYLHLHLTGQAGASQARYTLPSEPEVSGSGRQL